ncbi:hypothetical protein EON65_29775 [archaeon]|nr:MAG: hypothetical protein EON65_29775 [archaeon]
MLWPSEPPKFVPRFSDCAEEIARYCTHLHSLSFSSFTFMIDIDISVITQKLSVLISLKAISSRTATNILTERVLSYLAATHKV